MIRNLINDNYSLFKCKFKNTQRRLIMSKINDVEKLIESLKEIEDNYRMDNNKLNYNNGFADGVQKSINEINRLLND